MHGHSKARNDVVIRDEEVHEFNNHLMKIVILLDVLELKLSNGRSPTIEVSQTAAQIREAAFAAASSLRRSSSSIIAG